MVIKMNFIPCLYAYLACAGFCIIMEIKRPLMFFLACITGTVSWFTYLMLQPIGSEIARYLLATIICSLFAELFARILKAPATIFLIIGIVPLVPGGGLYYTMEALINRNTNLFFERGLNTAAIAAAIAAGVSLVSSLVKIITRVRKKTGTVN